MTGTTPSSRPWRWSSAAARSDTALSHAATVQVYESDQHNYEQFTVGNSGSTMTLGGEPTYFAREHVYFASHGGPLEGDHMPKTLTLSDLSFPGYNLLVTAYDAAGRLVESRIFAAITSLSPGALPDPDPEPNAVPELDPNGATSAFTLLACAGLLLSAPRRRAA